MDATPPRRRVLVLTPRSPFDGHGGDRVRILGLCRVLARRHDLSLLTLCDSPEAARALPADPAPFRRAEAVVLPRWRSWWQAACALPTAQPLQCAYYASAAFAARAQALAVEHEAVLCHLVRTAEVGRRLPLPRVLEMTDAISLAMARVQRVRPAGFDLRRWVYAVEARRLQRYEREVAASFDRVSFISAIDRDAVFGAGGASERAIVVPNGVARPVRAATAPREAGRLVFVGNFHTLQNQDALWWWLQEVWSVLSARVPSSRLDLVGPVPRRVQERLLAWPRVRALGPVPDLSSALAGAAIGVCPVRIASGVQNKVLDYLAHGLAAVTSPEGLEGLAAEPGRHLLVADSAAQWVQTLERLIAQPEQAQALGDAGQAWVQLHHDWAHCADALLAALEALCGASARAAALSR